MFITKVECNVVIKALSNFLDDEADLDTLAKLYSLYLFERPVQVYDKDLDKISEVFKEGKEIPNKTAKD